MASEKKDVANKSSNPNKSRVSDSKGPRMVKESRIERNASTGVGSHSAGPRKTSK